MKIDYDFLKQILTVMVDNESHFIRTDQLTDKLDLDICNKLLWNKFWGHMFILNDNLCLDCDDENLGAFREQDGSISYRSQTFRLTAQGYQFLDVLKNDTIFSKIKDFSVSTAIEVGKAALINWVIQSS
ncbi:MAG: hypothetical protein SO314_05355 [Alphaproteobacteria bacterium]|nr:hypothetical protein [Alphaproteobacteria bacterium]